MTPAYRHTSLGDFLAAAARTPWQAGSHDCTAWPARWAGIELPSYSDDAEAARLVQEAGGLVPLWTRHINGRLARVSEPLAGDIGVIELLTTAGRLEMGAIRSGARWAVLTHRGIASVPAQALAIWRVPCRRP